MPVGDPAADRETRGRCPGSPVVRTVERLEDELALLGRDADAVVGDPELAPLTVATSANVTCGPDPGSDVLDCVAEQVVEQLPHQPGVGPDREVRGDRDLRRPGPSIRREASCTTSALRSISSGRSDWSRATV